MRAEATAKHQTALHLTPAALKLPPATLAEQILATQREAQEKAEAALTEHLDNFRADPRVTQALETLRDTQANPKQSPQPTPRRKRDEEDHFVDSVYNSNNTW